MTSAATFLSYLSLAVCSNVFYLWTLTIGFCQFKFEHLSSRGTFSLRTSLGFQSVDVHSFLVLYVSEIYHTKKTKLIFVSRIGKKLQFKKWRFYQGSHWLYIYKHTCHTRLKCVVSRPSCVKYWNNLLCPCRVGIIGEPMSGFNPLTLAPFGEEQEAGEETESRRRLVNVLVDDACGERTLQHSKKAAARDATYVIVNN